MAAQKITQRLRRGEVLFGLLYSFPAPGIIEKMCPGWDWVWIDAQHGQLSYESTLQAVRTASSLNLASVVRVPGHTPGVLGKYADMAPWAIMVPMVDTPEDATQVVQALRFPPLGRRSYGGRRAFDLFGPEYHRNADPLVIAQIETLAGVRHVDTIAETEGIDVLFLGADDMKIALGIAMSSAATEDNRLHEIRRTVAKAARAANKFAGCVAATTEAVAIAVDMGYQILVAGGDVLFLHNGSRKKLEQVRRVKDSDSTPAG